MKNSEIKSNILRKPESVRKDIINLKNDMQEIQEALKSLLTRQEQSKHEQEISY